MKSNPLLKWLLIPMALLLVFVGFKTLAGRSPKVATDNAGHLTADEAKAVGIEGDTPRDTVATLVAQVKQLRGELQTTLKDNKTQKDENERLRAREGSIDQRVQTALDGEHEQASNDHQQTQGLLQDLQRRLETLSGKGDAGKSDPGKGGSADLPIGLGLEDGDGKNLGSKDDAGARWIEPDDVKPTTKRGDGGAPGRSDSSPESGSSFATSFGSASKSADQEAGAASATETSDHDAEKGARRPVFTLPANSTLVGSVAMTALIGRVPIDGTVNDPYPFKVVIGADNLTANGIDLPDVAGAIASGTASGDWTLSCVRGQIRSLTFVFHDGTVRTVPEDKGGSQGGNQDGSTGTGASTTGQGNGSTQGGLGWISDDHGVPCVSGERRSNAQQYLGSRALITAAGAGAASLIKPGSGDVAVAANANGTLGTVGIGGNEAMGRILAGGVHDTADWVNKLYGQAFAAVYVPPTAQVAIHLEHSINIDYDAHGRRVDHRLGGIHASNLD